MKIRNLPQLLAHSSFRPIGEAIQDLLNGINSVGEQAGILPSNSAAAPSPPASISVSGSGGIVDIQIIHSDPVYKSVNYYVEYSTSSGFPAASTHVIDMGSSRNIRYALFMGATLVYFRAYAQYPGGPASKPTVYGNPTGVNAGGSGPSMQTGQSSGSGNPPTDTGVGAGANLVRTQNGIKPRL